jgi:hypothetical protein
MVLSNVKAEVTPAMPTGMVMRTVPDPKSAAAPAFQ